VGQSPDGSNHPDWSIVNIYSGRSRKDFLTVDLEAVLTAPHDKSSNEDGLGAVKRTSRRKDGLGLIHWLAASPIDIVWTR